MSTHDHPDWWRPMGGQNSQDSILERRSLVWNDDENIPVADRVRFETDAEYKGKFFPRGCRGKIEQIHVYSRRPTAGVIILRLSPHPCLGPFQQVILTPGVAWGWWPVTLEEMWDYDSLFIWIYDVSGDIEWVYDAFQPYDGHESTDAGATWADLAIRPFIRVVYTGETPGDVPVSGIVNTIPIPNIASELTTGLVLNVPTNAFTVICTGEGAGTMLEARIILPTSVAPTAGALPGAVMYVLNIYVDGALAYTTNNRIICQSQVATAGRSSAGEFYQATVAEPAYDRTVLAIRIPFQFRRTLSIEALQSTGGPVNITGHIYANELR